MCNGFVNFVFKRDKAHQFKFASLQSTTANSLLSKQDLGLTTLIIYENGEIYRKSNGALRVCFALGGGWTILSMLFSMFPLFLRDNVYDFVARNRYQFFGKYESCRIPSVQEKAHFLE